MERRRYLAVVGAAIVAGCPSGGSAEQATATPTATRTATATQTATPAGETGTATNSSALADAREAIRDGYDAYLQQGDGARTLVEVGPTTQGFDAEAVSQPLDEALDRLGGVGDASGSADGATAAQLGTVARWLRNAAAVQGATSEFAGAVADAGAASRADTDLATIAGHLRDARNQASAIFATRNEVFQPQEAVFEAFEPTDPADVQRKYEQFQAALGGFSEVARLLERTLAATDQIQTARDEVAAGNDEEAASLASNAVAELSGVDADAAEVDAAGLAPLIQTFRDVLETLEGRAAAIRDNAQQAS